MEKIQLYDSINTTAVQWLTWLYKEHKQPLSLSGFNYKDLTHLWLLQMMEAFSVYNGYCIYYVDCGFFMSLYLRYYKHYKHLRNSKIIPVFNIVINDFIKELVDGFEVPKHTILKMYNLFWGKY